MDIITHLCFVAIYSFPPFFPHLKCFARFYYLRQEELLFNKQKQHLTMAISSTDSTPTKRNKNKRQIWIINAKTSGANFVDISLMLVWPGVFFFVKDKVKPYIYLQKTRLPSPSNCFSVAFRRTNTGKKPLKKYSRLQTSGLEKGDMK